MCIKICQRSLSTLVTLFSISNDFSIFDCFLPNMNLAATYKRLTMSVVCFGIRNLSTMTSCRFIRVVNEMGGYRRRDSLNTCSTYPSLLRSSKVMESLPCNTVSTSSCSLNDCKNNFNVEISITPMTLPYLSA